MTGFARVVQLSDLHFGPKLTHEGRAFYKRPFLWPKARPHSFSKLVSLARKIEEIERHQGKFDVTLVTGDLVTDGSFRAFEWCRAFLEFDAVRDGHPSRPALRGLGINAQRRILLPGNHDRFRRAWFGLQRPGATFEQRLGTRTDYPYVVGYRNAGTRNIPDEPAILFFVFDSTLSLFADTWFWNRVARGRLEPGDCDVFLDRARDIATRGTVRAPDGVSTLNVRYSNCVRVATLHHHPLDRASTTLMENNREFIKYCFRAGIHLVLFGHDHREFWDTQFYDAELTADRDHKMTFFCCPSASEYASENGFYTFEFEEDNVSFTFYKWDKLMLAFAAGGLDENNKFLRYDLMRIHFSHRLH